MDQSVTLLHHRVRSSTVFRRLNARNILLDSVTQATTIETRNWKRIRIEAKKLTGFYAATTTGGTTRGPSLRCEQGSCGYSCGS
ncbi:unnamed protein product [Lathyrus oleraceus]